MHEEEHDRIGSRAVALLSRVFRCPVGNVLLLANTLLLVRAAMLRSPYDHVHTDCTLVGDSVFEDGACYLPSFFGLLYNVIHLPAILLVGLAEFLVQPAWNMLCIVTAAQLEQVLFALASGLEWLVIGYLCKTLVVRHLGYVEQAPPPAPAIPASVAALYLPPPTPAEVVSVVDVCPARGAVA